MKKKVAGPDPIIVPKSQKRRIRATRDFVVIHPDEPMKTSPNGLIVVPETVKENDRLNPPSGIVVSVGNGLIEGGQIIPLTVKVGQRVYIPRNSGTVIRDHPIVEDCFICRENQIFGWDDEIRDDEVPALGMKGPAAKAMIEVN